MNYYQLPLTIKIYIKIYLSRYITSSGNTRAQNIPKELEEQYREIINTLLKEEPNKIEYEQELWKLENIGYEKTAQQLWLRQPINIKKKSIYIGIEAGYKNLTEELIYSSGI